jgi:hypothetical protein
MNLDDHTVSDIWGFCGLLATTVVTQIFQYYANNRRSAAQTATLRGELLHSEDRLASGIVATNKTVESIQATATNSNKEIAVVKAMVDKGDS